MKHRVAAARDTIGGIGSPTMMIAEDGVEELRSIKRMMTAGVVAMMVAVADHILQIPSGMLIVVVAVVMVEALVVSTAGIGGATDQKLRMDPPE